MGNGVKITGAKVATGKGTALKRLKNITCPYTGIRMISGSEMSRIEERFRYCNSIKGEALSSFKICQEHAAR